MSIKNHVVAFLLVVLAHVAMALPAQAQQPAAGSQLEEALNAMYTACLFGEGGPFSQAVNLTQQALSPGISNFIESNLASIPLTPPSLDAEYQDGEIITVVAGFTPIFTESSATVGGGQFLIGTNASYFNLSKIRGENLSDMFFAFQQNGGGDVITVNMPIDIEAAVVTLYGSYGLTDRLDIGFALPIVNLSFTRQATNFTVVGDQTGCRYGQGCVPGGTAGSPTVDYTFAGGVAIDVGADENVDATPDLPAVPETETYLSTLALRAKYRFPTSLTNGRMAALVDVRLPVGRTDGQVLGSGTFGTRVMLIGEYNPGASFKPYVNLGAQFWNGDFSNSLKVATGFTQRMTSKLFFAFDLLGEVQIENPPFLAPLDDNLSANDSPEALSLVQSSIPALERDHTLNAGLGLQVAVTPQFQVYGSALFALLDRGLQSTIAPTIGAALYF